MSLPNSLTIPAMFPLVTISLFSKSVNLRKYYFSRSFDILIHFLNSLYLMLSHPQSPWIWTNKVCTTSLTFFIIILQRAERGHFFLLGQNKQATIPGQEQPPGPREGLLEPDQSQKVSPHWGSPFGALELRSGKIGWMVRKSLRSVDSVHPGR